MAEPVAEAPPAPPKAKKEPSRFSQQQMWACRPIITPLYVVIIFLVVSVITIPLGVACIVAYARAVEIKVPYDDLCIAQQINKAIANGAWSLSPYEDPAASKKRLNRTIVQQFLYRFTDLIDTEYLCTITMPVKKDMNEPVHVYYEMTNFFQNHRLYLKSRSDAELVNDKTTTKQLDYCKPELYSKKYNFKNETSRIYPCGLTAWSYFNDTFVLDTVSRPGDGVVPVVWDEKGIAWEIDRKKKYKDVKIQNFNDDPALRGGATLSGPVNKDEHFMVWMRSATLPKFRKLYSRIRTDLKKGDIVTLTVVNRFNSYRYRGRKSLVLATSSWIGGKNPFLGVAFLSAGGTSFLFAVFFFALDRLYPRKVGDLSHLSWNKKQH